MENKTNPPSHFTVLERLQWYVDNNQEDKGRQLAHLVDYLEECYSYEIGWAPEAEA